MFDVLVIGGGLAGATAAVAARRAGARVAVASRSWGATGLSTGALDIAFTPALSHVHQTAQSIAGHVMDIVAHRRRHPYAVLGLERTLPALEQGFAQLSQLLAGSGLEPPPLDLEGENSHLASSLGTLMPAASALAPHVGLDFGTRTEGRWGVLQLLGHPSFDARRVVQGVGADAEEVAGSRPELAVIELGFEGGDSDLSLARALDDQARADSLARELASRGKGLAGVIAPPVLGLSRSEAVRRRLSEAVGAPVVEALAHMPSVPGVRLQRALDHAVTAAGIDNVGEIAAAAVEGRRVRSMTTRDGLAIHAGAFVLATGRFIAGGVVWNETCQEALLGLPVATESGLLEELSPHPVVRETPMESHPLMTAGVQVTPGLQPIQEGRVAYDNLWAAGMVIGGFASRYALCADGVALATGVLAGRAAAGNGGEQA